MLSKLALLCSTLSHSPWFKRRKPENSSSHDARQRRKLEFSLSSQTVQHFKILSFGVISFYTPLLPAPQRAMTARTKTVGLKEHPLNCSGNYIFSFFGTKDFRNLLPRSQFIKTIKDLKDIVSFCKLKQKL